MYDPSQTDETLVMLTLAGEQQAYETLVVRYERAVIAAANSVTRNRSLAEDAAQDAFVTAWMKLNLLREPQKYGAWVCRIAKNCAKNTVRRFRLYVDYDEVENYLSEEESQENPEALYALSEENRMLHDSLDGLSEKVGEVIRLYYFEELSIAEIAERMRITKETVKWRLHDGRKRIRKDLCAMNEEMNDTLLRRVMKKVEELKQWQRMSCKNGFEEIYRDVLEEVEELPESEGKYHALADVLMRGWWWIPGQQNDALLARIAEAAEKGKNDDVMEFITVKEDQRIYGDARMDYMKENQIPRLREGGFFKALSTEWTELGRMYFEKNEWEPGFEALGHACTCVPPSDIRYAKARAMEEMYKLCRDRYPDTVKDRFRARAVGMQLQLSSGTPVRYGIDWNGAGYLCSADLEIDFIFRNASACDGNFVIEELPLGEAHIGSDGTTLTHEAEGVTVETPAGTFENCTVWVTESREDRYKTYFKEGVGIVKQERFCDDITETRLLSAYTVKGGEGILPCSKDNEWEYVADYDPTVMNHACRFRVCHADGEKAILQQIWYLGRLRYDENSWLDMIQEARNEYVVHENGKSSIQDVTRALARAAELAETPLERAHTEVAGRVLRRIVETSPKLNSDGEATGCWNFFERTTVHRQRGDVFKLLSAGNFRWSFEWKYIDTHSDYASIPLLHNNIYGFLQTGANCLWSDKWKPGATCTEEFLLWGHYPIKTAILCENGGDITTKAGTFRDCLKVSLDIQGFEDGLDHLGGKKTYFFAPGVGIVRTENEYLDGMRTSVYELVAYEGVGEGYMPLEDGMTRRYEAQGLTDGYEAGAEYTLVNNRAGETVILEDRSGLQRKQSDVTRYASIRDEQIEDALWEAKKYDESRLRHDVNNFNLLQHFFGRYSRYWAAPKKAVAWNKHRMQYIELLAEGGEIPRAWLGHYAATCFRTACALFGCGEKEEGYRYLDRAFEPFEKWDRIPDGTPLEVGCELIYGGVRVVKGRHELLLPDGTREPLQYRELFSVNGSLMYYGMTAKRGWEWFNGVRDEERFRAAIERAKPLAMR